MAFKQLATVLAGASMLGVVVAAPPVGAAAPPVGPAGDCRFVTTSTTMRLLGNCTMFSTLHVPAGKTLDGRGFTIMVLRDGEHVYEEAAVIVDGPTGGVRNLDLDLSDIEDTCPGGGEFAGILLKGAGSVRNSALNGPQCTQGIEILAMSAPFDGSHPATKAVTISGNRLSGYVHGGIEVRGDVRASVSSNTISTLSSNQRFGIAVTAGATGAISSNTVTGPGAGIGAPPGVGVQILESSGVKVTGNTIAGVGFGVNIANACSIPVTVDGTRVEKNTVQGADVGVQVGTWVNEDEIRTSVCSALITRTSVKDNKFTGRAGAYSGVKLYAGETENGFTPAITATSIRRNTISSFQHCVNETGATGTSQVGNICS